MDTEKARFSNKEVMNQNKPQPNNIIVLEGKIEDVFPVETFGENGFRVRKFWLTATTGRYPMTWELQLVQDAVDLIDYYKPGDVVGCTIEVQGRKSNSKGRTYVFNSLQVSAIRKQQ